MLQTKVHLARLQKLCKDVRPEIIYRQWDTRDILGARLHQWVRLRLLRRTDPLTHSRC